MADRQETCQEGGYEEHMNFWSHHTRLALKGFASVSDICMICLDEGTLCVQCIGQSPF
jgi:hypothetical protein